MTASRLTISTTWIQHWLMDSERWPGSGIALYSMCASITQK
jgi:hypothetical protein